MNMMQHQRNSAPHLLGAGLSFRPAVGPTFNQARSRHDNKFDLNNQSIPEIEEGDIEFNIDAEALNPPNKYKADPGPHDSAYLPNGVPKSTNKKHKSNNKSNGNALGYNSKES